MNMWPSYLLGKHGSYMAEQTADQSLLHATKIWSSCWHEPTLVWPRGSLDQPGRMARCSGDCSSGQPVVLAECYHGPTIALAERTSHIAGTLRNAHICAASEQTTRVRLLQSSFDRSKPKAPTIRRLLAMSVV